MPSLLSFHDQQHVTRMFIQEQRVNAVFNQFVRSIAPEMRRWKDAGNKNSVWIRNGDVENAIDRLLIGLQKNLETEIKNGQSTAWHEAIKKNDKLVEKYIEGMPLKSIVKEGLFKRNLDALTALQNRTENGLNLSQRVWNITKQTKGHVELFLESGIATNRNAEQISRDFRQLLQNPDKRFRRVRNKEGKLVLSQPMKDYHPGQGVYRSSRMNALRVSATETNMGYRVSDSERWGQLDFVLGFEVKRSRNGHPCALCDSLVGKYPKDFVFPGWHPFCICVAVPIVMDHDDFADYLLHDEIPADKYVQDIPVRAGEWMNSYVKKTGKVPYFLKNNESFISGDRGNIEITAHRLNKARKPVEKQAYVSFEPFSPVIVQELSKLKTVRDRQKLLRGIVEDDNFKMLFSNEKTGAMTVMHPLHKWKSNNYWEQTKLMAKNINASGGVVAFLPEYKTAISADAIVEFNNKLTIADFKYSKSSNWNTLSKELRKGFDQAGTIVLKLEKMDSGNFKRSIEYILNNGYKYGNIKLINKRGKIIDISWKNIRSGSYKKKIKGFL